MAWVRAVAGGEEKMEAGLLLREMAALWLDGMVGSIVQMCGNSERWW